MFSDVQVIKQQGGIGKGTASIDSNVGLVAHGVAVAGKLVLGTSYPLFSLKDAEALGIDAAYDTANEVLVYYHISEFFRINPNAKLWILLAAQATDWKDLADPTKAFGKKLLADAEGEISILAIAFNPADVYVPVLDGGLDAKVTETMAQAQLLAAYQEEQNAPIIVLVEGRSFNGTAAAADDLRVNTQPNVSCVIGNDYAMVATSAAHAAIGTMAGVLSLAKVNENIAWPERFNVRDTNKGKFVELGLSSGVKLATIDPSAQVVLNTKGYIFVRSIVGLSGAYFNDSHTAVALTSDYSHQEYNRVMNKAWRLVRASLLPKVASPIAVDTDNGQLPVDVIKQFEAIGNEALSPMVRDGEISGRTVTVDAAQNILTTSTLEVEFEITPTGSAKTIKAKIGFNNPFKS